MQQGLSLGQCPEERGAEKSPSFTRLSHPFRTLFLSWVTKNHLASPKTTIIRPVALYELVYSRHEGTFCHLS